MKSNGFEEMVAIQLAVRSWPVQAHYEAIQEQWREKYPDIWPPLQPLGTSAIHLAMTDNYHLPRKNASFHHCAGKCILKTEGQPRPLINKPFLTTRCRPSLDPR